MPDGTVTGNTQVLVSAGRGTTPSRRSRPTRFGALIVAATALIGVPACTAQKSPAFNRADFTPNREQYVLPLDAYRTDPAKQDFARNLLIQECLKGTGIMFRVHDNSHPAGQVAISNKQFRRLFTVQIAQLYGYAGPPLPPVVPPSATPYTDADKQQLVSCGQKASKDLKLDQNMQSRIEVMIAAAYDKAQARPEAAKEIAAWKACLQPLGIADFPKIPEDMPTDSQAERWRVVAVDDTSTRTASPDEIRQAVLDAQCRESTGYAQHAYQAEVDAQFDIMTKEPEFLEQAKAYADAATEQLSATIKRLSG